jgi:hypothetical protein
MMQCSWGSRRSRVRAVLRLPDPTSAPVCPPTEETGSCLANTTCWTYSWQLTPWSSCRADGPHPAPTCGPGTMTRGKQCIR